MTIENAHFDVLLQVLKQHSKDKVRGTDMAGDAIYKLIQSGEKSGAPIHKDLWWGPTFKEGQFDAMRLGFEHRRGFWITADIYPRKDEAHAVVVDEYGQVVCTLVASLEHQEVQALLLPAMRTEAEEIVSKIRKQQEEERERQARMTVWIDLISQ